jgi:hypothetical protein
MSAGAKPLTGPQQEAVWKLAQKHQILLLEQGTQTFDEALFAFTAEAVLLLTPSAAELFKDGAPCLMWRDHAGEQQALSLEHLQRAELMRKV